MNARISELASLPRTLLIDVPVSVIRTGVSVAITPFALLALGKSTDLNEWALVNSAHLGRILPSLFEKTIKIINPKASLPSRQVRFVSSRTFHPIKQKAKSLAKSQSFFNREVGSRVLHFITAPVGVVASVADLAIGILFAGAAILTLGTFESLNHRAYTQLDSLYILTILAVSLLQTVNPKALF